MTSTTITNVNTASNPDSRFDWSVKAAFYRWLLAVTSTTITWK